jgi:uncharacterized cupin superfamily protein
MSEGKSHGVIDLRAYAQSASPSRDWYDGRSTPAFTDSAITVSALAPIGNGQVDSSTADEFLCLLSGRLTLTTAGAVRTVDAGRSVVLPAGLRFGWSAAPGTLAVSAAHAAARGTSHDAVPIDESAPLTASNPPLAELLVGPTPSCRNFTDYRSHDTEFVCGTWDSTPYHRLAMPYRHVELMHLLDGSVTFEDSSGTVTFKRGDICLAKRGAGCAWISPVPVKKVYAIHRPA